MSHTVGVSLTCNSNCTEWCPRSLRVAFCCFRCTSEAHEENEVPEIIITRAERVDAVAINLLTNGDTNV